MVAIIGYVMKSQNLLLHFLCEEICKHINQAATLHQQMQSSSPFIEP
ncbi:hypothetical protein HMPREF0758_0100 [Serratia odorifera DSM 4582]|uniref:Uncharacterized protein n=2 Tax=Serratia TaxID=613 RepID=D4DW00_SEROD|nr:hypothetical protein HMPREF0758_0100 [Serratia odorifera DSM 4582]